MRMRFRLLLSMLGCFWMSQLQAQDQLSLAELRAKTNHSEGKDKYALLEELNERMVERLDSNALEVAKEAVALAIALKDEDLELKAKCLEASTFSSLGKPELAAEMLEKLETGEAGEYSQEAKMVLLGTKGGLQHELGEYGLAEYYLGKAKGMAKSLQLPDKEAEYVMLLAYNHRYKGELDKATAFCYEALRLFESLGDSSQAVNVKIELGILQYLEGEPSAALDYFKNAASYYERKNDSLPMALSYSMIGLSMYNLERFEESEEYCLRSLDIRDKLGDLQGKGESLNNLALSYMGRKRWQEAEHTFLLAMENVKKGGDQREIPVILGNLGDARRMQGDTDGAMRYYEEAIAGAEKLHAKIAKSNVYLKIVRLYQKSGDFEQAFTYLNAYSKLQDSIYNEEKLKAVSQLKVEYETEVKERQIALLQEEAAFDQRKLLFTVVAMGMALAVLGLFLALQYTRRKRDSLLHEKEKEILRGREQLRESELRNAQNELDYHKNMLASYTDHLLRKNALLEQMEEQLQQLKADGKADQEAEQENMGNLLSMKILRDEDWEEFKQHFEHVHAGLLGKLRQNYPQLTVAETRLFILLKLQLDSKTVANILGVSFEEVAQSRHRLRKKLELDEDVKLEDFIESV